MRHDRSGVGVRHEGGRGRRSMADPPCCRSAASRESAVRSATSAASRGGSDRRARWSAPRLHAVDPGVDLRVRGRTRQPLGLRHGRRDQGGHGRVPDHHPDAVEARRAAAETINRQFGENVYNIWMNHSQWGIVSQPYVNGAEAAASPDGTPIVGLAGAGAHQTNHMWCDEGTCEPTAPRHES